MRQRTAAARKTDLVELRSRMADRLREQRAEIEAEAQVRLRAVSDPEETGDPTYVQGLRTALAAAFDYALAGMEEDPDRQAPVPPVALLAQARLAARSGVSLDTVLRRYFAGYTLFSDFLMRAAEVVSFPGQALQRLMRIQAARFDRLVAAITDEYGDERARRPGSIEERRAQQVEDMLNGESPLGQSFDYDLQLQHVGLVADGSGAAAVVESLAQALGYRPLLVRPEERTVWVWFGAAQGVDPDRVRAEAADRVDGEVLIALGEPGQGLSGWRLTHRQARAALTVARRRSSRVVRYADVAVLASALQDELLATSLRQLYLDPLATARNGGDVLVETLRAYLSAGQSLTSAAAVLGVNRGTVAYRLQAVEERLGRPIRSCLAGLTAALEVAEIGRLSKGDAAVR